MNPTEKNKEIEFPINQELLASSTKAKEEWKITQERINKIEEHKEQVSPPVYERVLKDYRKKLDKIIKDVLDKKKAIDRELVNLYETQKRISTELETHKHTLEETKFRNLLGEYTEDEFQQKSKAEQDKISKFETVLSAVNTNISRYEELFKDDIELLSAAERNIGKESETRLEKETGSVTSRRERDTEEIESGFITDADTADYFGEKDSGKDEKDEEIEYDLTDKTVPGKPPRETNARIVIISGEDAGATYPLKDTVTFGRAESSTVVLRDAKVSRQHAKIIEKGGEYILIDLKSSNGTYVNGERIDEHVLTNSDEFQIGDSLLQFQA